MSARTCGSAVVAADCERGVTVVDITSTRMLMAHGFLRRLFEVFERFKTPVDVVTTSEVSVSVTVDNPRRLDDILGNLRTFADVACEPQMAIVCVVGENLRSDPALFAKAVTSLDRIPLRLVSQAASRRNITFVLRDGNRCHYADEDAIAPLWKGLRFPMSACISGWSMLNRKPAVIPDIYADDRIPHDAYRPTFVKSLVMVPIRTLDPVGAIGNYWAAPHRPTEAEVKLLQALADTTAVAMENVRVFTELEERVKARTAELELANQRLEAANRELMAAHQQADRVFRAYARALPGTVLDVPVEVGQHVTAGTTLAVVEAMKMEHSVPAPVDGTVTTVTARPGTSVSMDAPLVTVEPRPGPADTRSEAASTPPTSEEQP